MKSFPFDSNITFNENGMPEYDRGADSRMLAEFLHLMFTDGIFPNPSTGLQVMTSDNEMSVTVKPGSVMIQGRMGIEESDRTLVFNSAGTNYDRIDSVVARLNINYDYRNVDLYIIKGHEADTPVAPEITRTDSIYELRLANVFISKKTTTISAERITDTRLGDDCGIVTSNPTKVDTTSIFNQYQAALDKYMIFVQECIDGTELAKLQGAIEDCLKSVSDGKKKVASAITAQGVNTAADAEFSVMATNIKTVGTNKYNAGVAATKVGTATASYVLTGYTFTSTAGVNLSGSMPQRGTLNWAPNGSATYSVPAGYYNGGTLNSAPAYSAGVTAADARANPSSANYQSGYNAGYSAGAGSVSLSTQSRAGTIYLSGGGGEGTPTQGTISLGFGFPHGVLGVYSFSTTNSTQFPIHSISISGNTVSVSVGNTITWWTGNVTATVYAYGY